MNYCANLLSPVSVPRISLRRIWKVDEGPRYDIVARGRSPEEWIGLRTLDGEGMLDFHGRRSCRVGGGTFVLFEHDRIRRYRCSGRRWHFRWFEFMADSLDGLPRCEVLHCPVTVEERAQLDRCHTLLRSNLPRAAQLATALFGALLVEFVYEAESLGDVSRPVEGVERAIGLMHRRLGRVGIADLAREANLGERRFRQVFRGATGMSPKRFHDGLRLSAARDLLSTTDLTLAQIADRLGFSSGFHLSRAFRKAFGVSPAAFRAGGVTSLPA